MSSDELSCCSRNLDGPLHCAALHLICLKKKAILETARKRKLTHSKNRSLRPHRDSWDLICPNKTAILETTRKRRLIHSKNRSLRSTPDCKHNLQHYHSPKNSRSLRRRPKTKRQRATTRQLNILRKWFRTEIYPTAQDRRSIAMATGMEDRKVQIWFQNQRAKKKRAPVHRKPTAQSTSESP